MLTDEFECFRNMSLKIYELDPGKFLSALGIAWKVALKKSKVKPDLLTDIDMLLMVKKGIRGEYVTIFIDIRNLYVWAMLQKLPVNNFEWFKDTS